MKSPSTFLPVFVIIICSLWVQSAQSETVLFSEETGTAPGWSFTPWGGLEATTSEQGEFKAILLKPGNETVNAWAGVTIGKWKDPVSLDNASVTDGVISFKVNSTNGGGQRLQVSVGILDGEGNLLDGTEAFIPLSETSDFTAVDDDPTAWQTVTIPLMESLNLSGNPVDNAQFLGKIAIQCIEEASENDLLITDVKLVVP